MQTKKKKKSLFWKKNTLKSLQKKNHSFTIQHKKKNRFFSQSLLTTVGRLDTIGSSTVASTPSGFGCRQVMESIKEHDNIVQTTCFFFRCWREQRMTRKKTQERRNFVWNVHPTNKRRLIQRLLNVIHQRFLSSWSILDISSNK